MNILFLCDEYPPGRHGGIGTAVQLLARELMKNGHQVIVAGFYDWGYGGADKFDDQGVTVYRFRRSLAFRKQLKRDTLSMRIIYKLLYLTGLLHYDIRISMKRYSDFLADIINKHKIDIIEMPDFADYVLYTHTPVFFPSLSVPYVVKLHGSSTYFLKEAGKPVPDNIYLPEQQILRGASAVCSVSAYTAKKTAIYFRYDKRIHVIHNGIPITAQKNHIPKKVGNVIFTGALSEKKGIFSLMKAWNLVHKAFPQAQLHIYGKGPVEKIKPLLDTSAVSSVYFEGHIDREQLFVKLAEANIAVFPSYAECFALAPMEAMANGTAVIYSSRTSGSELITDGVNGLLVDPDDIEQIAEKIIYLLNHNDVCHTLAENGRKLIQEKFDIRIITAMHIPFYQEVLAAVKNNQD